MSKHSTIVVDYFNFGLIYHLYNIRPRSCVYVLFHSKNRLVEAAICAWMEWRGIKIVFINFYTKSSYRNHTELVDSLTTSFIEEDGSMFIDEKYLYTRVGHIFCVRMYRIASIIEFVRSCDELRKIEHLYVSYPHISKKIIRKLNINDVKFYRSLGREDDFECQNNYRPSQYSSFLLTIKYFFSLVYAFIDFTPRCWPKNLRIKGIFCVHGDTEKERFFSQDLILNSINDSGTINSKLELEYKGVKYNCNRLSVKDIIPFWQHIFAVNSIITSIYKVFGMSAVFILLKEWIHYFYLEKMFSSIKPAIFYSNTEGIIPLISQIILKESNCVSAASVYSAGYFPVKYEFSHQVKSADIFFVWGQCLSDLYLKSGDMSCQHVIAGYPGDHFRDEFYSDFNDIFKDNHKPIISIYDTTLNDDMFLNKSDMLIFIERVVRYSINLGALVMIKTKKEEIGSHLYEGICNEFLGQVHLVYEKASLIASIKADLVIGDLSATLVLVSAAWGKNVAFFDPHGMIWGVGEKCLGNSIVRNMDDLFARIDEAINRKGTKILSRAPCVSDIDPFADGKSTQRISSYLLDIIEYSEYGKTASISYANNKYCNYWGDSYIVKNHNNMFNIN